MLKSLLVFTDLVCQICIAVIPLFYRILLTWETDNSNMVQNFQVEPGLSSWACQAGLESRWEQSFMRFSYSGQARNFARAAFLMIFWHLCFFLDLPEARRQSRMKTLMESATSLNLFDLQLEPGSFMFFLMLYLCPAVICRSSCFLTLASFLCFCKCTATHWV